MAELVVSLTPAVLPPAALELVSRGFLDVLGCSIVGAQTLDARLAREWALSASGPAEATLVGAGGRTASVALAALANGVAAHALDLDDFCSVMFHPSAFLVPALLALGELHGTSGSDLAVAYVAGFEVAARICMQLNPAHYERGWHSSSTVGVLASAAACARLLDLDREGVATAVGIAASSAGGLRDNFGSMVKPLHAGNVAFHGVMAAELASRGFTADAHVLDGSRGYLSVYGNETTAGVPADLFRRDSLLLLEKGISFKRYACCGALHSSVDAVLELVETHGFVAADVERVRCGVHRLAREILIHRRASTPAQGRFSIEYTLAVALLDGDAALPQYADRRVGLADVQDLSQKVEAYTDESLATLGPSTVTVELRDGSTWAAHVREARGRQANPFSGEELDRKFRSCATAGLDMDAVERLRQLALALPALSDTREVARALGAARS
jgi:2-methylcitrate dehydratase PrpD